MPTLRWGLVRWYFAKLAEGAIPRRGARETLGIRLPGAIIYEARVLRPKSWPLLRAVVNIAVAVFLINKITSRPSDGELNTLDACLATRLIRELALTNRHLLIH